MSSFFTLAELSPSLYFANEKAIAAPTTNIPPKRTTVELDKPLNTCFAGINPSKPHAIAPAIEVIAKGISSVTKNTATIATRIKHLIAGDIRIPPYLILNTLFHHNEYLNS